MHSLFYYRPSNLGLYLWLLWCPVLVCFSFSFFNGRLPYLHETKILLQHKLEGIVKDNWLLIWYIKTVSKWIWVSEMFTWAIYDRLEEICRCRKLGSWQKKQALSKCFEVGKHPTAISNWLFYHCDALGLSSHWPVYVLEWFQTWYSDSKLV